MQNLWFLGLFILTHSHLVPLLDVWFLVLWMSFTLVQVNVTGWDIYVGSPEWGGKDAILLKGYGVGFLSLQNLVIPPGFESSLNFE